MLKNFLALIFVFTCFCAKANMIVEHPSVKYFGDKEQVPLKKMFAKDIKEAEDYLNSFNTLTALFKQSNAKGEISHGKLFISKPAKIRCEYYNPSPVLLIANGNKIIYYDKELDEVSYTSSDINALKLLSSDNINLTNANVVEFEKENHFLTIGIQDLSKELNQDVKIIFKFTYPKIELKQMSILTEDNEINMVFEKMIYNQILRRELFTFHRNILDRKNKNR